MTYSVRSLLLNRLQADLVISESKVPAPERALLALMLSQDQKLIRDCAGHWNHSSGKRQRSVAGRPPAPFQTGFTDKTVLRLIEADRAYATKYDDRGQMIEIKWVPI